MIQKNAPQKQGPVTQDQTPQQQTTAQTGNLDAEKQATLVRALGGVTKEWRAVCGSLLSDVDAPKDPPAVAAFKSGAYALLARRDGQGQAGLPSVKQILGLTVSRQGYFQALEVLESDVKQDVQKRDKIHEALVDLEAGGQVRFNSDRIIASYGMLTAGGREWWKGDDAKEWVGAYAAYLQNSSALVAHVTAESGYLTAGPASITRRQNLLPLLNLLRLGALAQKEAPANAQATTTPGPTEEQKKQWDEQAKALKLEIEPHLPPDGAVGKDAKAKNLDLNTRTALIQKITAAPIEVRDRLSQDTMFMRRVALLGESTTAGRSDEGGGEALQMQTLFRALDPIEALGDKCAGKTVDKSGVIQNPQEDSQGKRVTPSGAEIFGFVRDFLLAHPGKENQALRLRAMANENIKSSMVVLNDQQQRDLWKLATRGALEETITDRLYAAVRGNNAQAAAQVLLSAQGEDRDQIRALQDDLVFRNSFASDAMRKEVSVDGVTVRPYDMLMLMWGLRPGDTKDPGQTGALENNPDDEQKPLNFEERQKIDKEIYNPTIAALKDDLSAADSWFFSGARTSDSDVVNHLNAFASKCAAEPYVGLIRRAGNPPGAELATRFNSQTGNSIHALIKGGCGDEARRTAERVLNITIDSASVGIVGGGIARAGDGPNAAPMKLEQALRETLTDGGTTVSQIVHEQAQKLRDELHEGLFWNGADVPDIQTIWNDTKAAVDPKLGELETKTKRKVWTIELLQNAYQEIDGPLLASLGKNLSESNQREVKGILGLSGPDIAKRAEAASTGPVDQKAAARQAAEDTFGAKAKELFEAFGNLRGRAEQSQFEAAKTKLGQYLALVAAAPQQPAGAPTKDLRVSREIAPDLAPGAGQGSASTPEDFYRVQFGLTPKNHAVQVARSFRTLQGEQADGRDAGGVASHKPEEVAAWLGVDPSLVSGAVQAPPDTERPVIDERNAKLVRPGFTVETATKNAADMWRILHEGGEIHLIQTMLYGPYNDEEQRLIRLAFRQLSGGIDWQFYIQQAKFQQKNRNRDEDASDDRGDERRSTVGGEGTAAGQQITGGKTVTKVVATETEMDTAVAVATHGELDIRDELRSAAGNKNVNEIFRIVDRADDAQCRTVLADTALVAQVKGVLDAPAWDRVYRVLTGQDGLNDRLESRAHGDYSSTWESIFGGTDEAGMKEDIKTYVHRMHTKFELEEMKKAQESGTKPDPEVIQLIVARRLRDACRQLASNPETNAILEAELSGTDLSSTRGMVMNAGEESNVAQLAGGGSGDDVLNEIKKMPKAERERRLNDPEYMQRLNRQLKPEDLQMALTLLQSTAKEEPSLAGTEAGPAELQDKLGELAKIVSAKGNHDIDDTLQKLVALSPAEHDRLIADPALVAQVLAVFKYDENKLEIAQRMIGFRKENADKELAHGVLYPDATGEACEGRTLSEPEKQRLAFLQTSAVARLQQGASLSWNLMLAQLVEVFKMDFKPHDVQGTAPGTGAQQQPTNPDPAKAVNPNADAIAKIERTMRQGVFDAAKPAMAKRADSEQKMKISEDAVLGIADPSSARVQEAWGTLKDDSDAVTDTLTNASDDKLIKDWTSVTKHKPNESPSMQDVYNGYRAAYDAAGGEKQESSPQQEKLQAAKLAFMNYVVDISSDFESEVLPNAGTNFLGLGADQDRTKAGDERSRTSARENKEYNQWRAIIRSRIPNLPKQKIAEALHATDRPDDVALIVNPNRSFQSQREFREDAYLQKFGTSGGGARVANGERAVVNDTMTRYEHDAGVAETNAEGGYGLVTPQEGAKVEATGAEVDRAMQEFTAARAKIAGMAGALVGLIAGAAITILTGGAGAGVAWMLVAGAISGAAGAAGTALTQKAIQGSDFEMSSEGLAMIAEGAISGMIFAGTTRMAQNMMQGLVGPASLKAQAEVLEGILKTKPTIWQQILAGAKGTAQASGEMMLSDGLAAAIETGLVPLNPGTWVHGFDEGVMRSRHQIRDKLAEVPQRLLTDAIMGALTHNVRSGVNALRGAETPVPLTPANKGSIKTGLDGALERMGKNAAQYGKVDEIMIQAFSSFAAKKLSTAAMGKPIDWNNIDKQIFDEFITSINGIGPSIHSNTDQLGARRKSALETELKENGGKLTEAEKAHYKAINPEYAAGEIVTIQEYLTARQGMFEGRVVLWEQAIHRELSPGERAAFEKWCREAADSVEYQQRLNTNPLTVKEVQAAGFNAKKGEDAAGTENLKPVDHEKKPVDQDKKPEPVVVKPEEKKPAPTQDDKPMTADELAKMTGKVEAIDGNFTGQARNESAPDKIGEEIPRALPNVAAQFGGAVEVVGGNTLKLEIGEHTITIQVTSMGAESTDVGRYRFTGNDGAIIEISDRARDKHVERAVADLIAEIRATREAQLAGKELPKENALGADAKGTELSAQDIGHLAQLKALLRQLKQAENPGEGTKANPVVVKQLDNDLSKLLEAMGMAAGASEKANSLIDKRLTPEERDQLAQRLVAKDETRRDGAKTELGDHAGVEVHNHFLGVVKPEAFADAAYEVEKVRLEQEAKEKGTPVQLPQKSGWELTLDRIAAMSDIAHKNDDGSKHERGGKFDKRGTSGDAVALARQTKGVLEGTVTVIADKNAPAWLTQGAAELHQAVAKLEDAKRGGDPNAIKAAEADVAAKRADLAQKAVNAALTATDETDFNSSYEIRDNLIKGTMGGPEVKSLQVELDAELAKGDKADKAKIKDLQAKIEPAAYNDVASQTVHELIKDGLLYNEQSNSLKKLNERFGKPMMDKVIWDVSAKMLEKGEITEAQAIQLRQLTMVITGFFGKEETRADEQGGVEKDKDGRSAQFGEASWKKTKTGLRDQLGIDEEGHVKKDGAETRSDVMGIDIAGPETARFDELGKSRFQELYRMLKQAAAARNRPLVLRPHVGEGFTDTEAGAEFNKNETKQKGDQALHYDRSRKNLDALLEAIADLQAKGELDPKLVTIRFGHATHATAEQAEKMAALGIIAEVNLHSNIMTGSLNQADPNNPGKSLAQENYDDHALLTFILLGTQTILSTDAHSVMDTNMKAEYDRAERIIGEFLHGTARVRVSENIAKGRGEKVVHNAGTKDERVEYLMSRGDLNGEELGKFMHGYESLHKWAADYQAGVAAGDKTDKLLWNDLFGLVADPTAKTDPGKRLHLRDLLRRLALSNGALDEQALAFGAKIDSSKTDLVRQAAKNLEVEAEGTASVERWQTHGLNEDPRGKPMMEDPEFVKVYEKWISYPDRCVRGEDGEFHPTHMDGVPEKYKAWIEAIVKNGNVSLMHKTVTTATNLAEAFPDLAAMDPKSEAYKAKRDELVMKFGEVEVAKYEAAVTGNKGDPSRKDMDTRVSSIISEETLAMLKSKFPGCEVFLTGSMVQNKELGKVRDIDLIVMAPENMTLQQRIELEHSIDGLVVDTTEEFAEQTKRPKLEVDAKVMTPREMFGLTTQKTEKGRSEMNYLRIDTTEKPQDKPDDKPTDN